MGKLIAGEMAPTADRVFLDRDTPSVCRRRREDSPLTRRRTLSTPHVLLSRISMSSETDGRV